jgi:hypothetical protein
MAFTFVSWLVSVTGEAVQTEIGTSNYLEIVKATTAFDGPRLFRRVALMLLLAEYHDVRDPDESWTDRTRD